MGHKKEGWGAMEVEKWSKNRFSGVLAPSFTPLVTKKVTLSKMKIFDFFFQKIGNLVGKACSK